jgi:hypothetical protein
MLKKQKNRVAKRTKVAKPKTRTSPKKSRPDKPALATAQAERPTKAKRIKGSFSMPTDDYALIAELKAVSKKAGRAVKKNELLRAGLRALKNMTDDALNGAIAALKPTKSLRR